MSSKLEILKNELDEAVKNSKSFEELQSISCKIDEEIVRIAVEESRM